LLQVAAAEELGGRMRTTGENAISDKDAKLNAENYNIGGFEGVKALVRAKWETTQYMLDKAGKQVLDLYRGIRVRIKQPIPTYTIKEVQEPSRWAVHHMEGGVHHYTFSKEEAIHDAEEYNKIDKKANYVVKEEIRKVWKVDVDWHGDTTHEYDYSPARTYPTKASAERAWETYIEEVERNNTKAIEIGREEKVGDKIRLPELPIQRNGAASTTVNRDLANTWGGSGGGRMHVTLRFEVPRTAVLSVPAYGQNNHHEHELIIAGTAWKGWDAWKGDAPEFDKVPINRKHDEERMAA
jgi:hypothetical protein